MSRRNKLQCIQNRYKLKRSGIVIKDDLSREHLFTLDLLYYDDRVKDTWVSNGKPYIQLEKDNSVHRINAGFNIEKLIYKHDMKRGMQGW